MHLCTCDWKINTDKPKASKAKACTLVTVAAKWSVECQNIQHVTQLSVSKSCIRKFATWNLRRLLLRVTDDDLPNAAFTTVNFTTYRSVRTGII